MEGSAKKRRICGNEGYEYEVFLSFRGPDTRSGFTDFLYTYLNDAGIRTFKDDEELRVGEEFAPELLQAINQSKISIPIFSKSYASSAWCLKELVRMVECGKTGRQKIMPVFYDVAPSEVRRQTEGYGAALLEHENKRRYGEDTINEWKASLGAVGEISGWDLHCQSPSTRREGEFAKKITEEVFRELKKAYLMVSDYLVNVDKHVDAIMEMIGAETRETRIIGIHGMGGIGKTTVAKLIYNKISPNFENSCFLRDIREASKDNGIQYLQNRLISDIIKTKCMDIKDIDEGTQTIKDRLSNKRVLLLLDDVEEENHIDALVCKRDWLGNGSKIIVTTRNKDVLNVPEVDSNYELSVMDSYQSLQLFSKHAFRRDFPLDEDMDQSKRAIGIAGGLPLALEVIGSLLGRTNKKEWDVELKKLESAPHKKVLDKLKISFDALDLQQKHIFLDIACLFIGHNKDILVHFWNESDVFPEEAMIVLENMSLIKINEENKVWMHDQLRDLGREIVRQSSGMKREKQSRVWDPKVGLDLLRRHKGKKEVEALRLKLDDQQRYRFTYEGFENLSNLRFLEMDGSMENFCAEDMLLWHESASYILATDENSSLLPQLRWLSWKNIPPSFKVTNFSMEEVVILDLSNSKITDDWSGWSHMEVMKNLKSLDLSNCPNLRRLPDKLGGNLARLEYLSLRGCTSLEMLPDTVGNLKSLDLSNCRDLQMLPNLLGSNLESLEYLSLRGCTLLEMLPVTVGNLKSLIELDISDTSIEELPDSIGKLKNLKIVKMRESGVRKIPHEFWTIEKLEEIEVGKRYSFNEEFHVRIGDGIYRNQSLRILSLTDANIHALPQRFPESLIELRLHKLHMSMFPDLSNLINLKELDLIFSERCDGNWELYGFVEDPMPRWIGNLSKLESLSLEFGCETGPATDISLPPRLKSLSLECANLRCLPKLPSSLSSLELNSCSSLCSMEDVSNLKNLSSLSISDAAITEIPGLGCLENLQELSLWGLKQLQILPDLSNLNNLTSLNVCRCDNVVEIRGGLSRSLHFLNISSCPSLRNLPDLSGLVSEQSVRISDCGNLSREAIVGFARKNPRDLELVGFNELHILPDLSESNELRRLKVSSCHNLVEIQGELPQSLEELVISSCTSFQKLPVLSNLKKLRSIKISGCRKLNVEAFLGFARKNPLNLPLQILPDLSDADEPRHLRAENCSNPDEFQGEIPESLEILDISFFEALYKLPDLSSLVGLQKVHISACPNLVEIQGQLPGPLQKLDISLCESLHELPDLSNLMWLREVSIRTCHSLVEIQGKLPRSLENLDISFCGFLLKLPELSNLMRLRKISISTCCSLVEIQGELPESLEELKISSCESLLKLPDLSSSKKLRRVDIEGCMKLKGEAILGSSYRSQANLWENLQYLRICGLGQLKILPDLSNSSKLTHLRVEKCDDLVEIQGELPPSLEELEISSCKSLQKWPGLSGLKGLRRLSVREMECGGTPLALLGEIGQI